MRRRTFLTSAASAAVVGMQAPSLKASERPPESALVSGELVPLPYTSIPEFLSAAQLSVHHKAHYGGALTAYERLDATLGAVAQGREASDADRYGALQRTRTSKANSVVLHELYFAGMTAARQTPSANVRSALARRFGSEDRWRADFLSCAAAAAGWALLVRTQGRLYNLVSDEHAVGHLVGGLPLLALDTYEHAYYIDYQNRKADYCAEFMNHVAWSVLDARIANG